jgi:cell division protein FtsL
MGALIVLLILIPVVIIILLLSLYSKASSQQQSLHELTIKLDDVTNQLKEVNKTLQQNQKGETPILPKQEIVPAQPVTKAG